MANVTGIITVNGKFVLEVDSNPAAGGGTLLPDGSDASNGSLAMLDTGTQGQVFIKFAAGATSWDIIDVSNGDWHLAGNLLTGVEFMGSTNAFDVPFRANNSEVFRLANATLEFLIGLTTTQTGKLQVQAAAAGNVVANFLTSTGIGTDLVSFRHRQYKVLTTDATLTTIGTLPIAASNRVIIKSIVMANQTGGGTGLVGDGASFENTLDAKNVAGTVTISTVQNDFTKRDTGVGVGVKTSFVVSGTNVLMQVTGAVGRNFTWTQTIRTQLAGA